MVFLSIHKAGLSDCSTPLYAPLSSLIVTLPHLSLQPVTVEAATATPSTKEEVVPRPATAARPAVLLVAGARREGDVWEHSSAEVPRHVWAHCGQGGLARDRGRLAGVGAVADDETGLALALAGSYKEATRHGPSRDGAKSGCQPATL